MREIILGRHSEYLLMYRIVWIPRCRRRILVEQVAERLKQTVRPSDPVKVFKGVSACILLKEFFGLA